jgi:hypothetical protein
MDTFMVINNLSPYHCTEFYQALISKGSRTETLKFIGVYESYYKKIIRAIGNGDTIVNKLILAFDEKTVDPLNWFFLCEDLREFLFSPKSTVELMIISSIGGDSKEIVNCISDMYFCVGRPFPPKLFITCPLRTPNIERWLGLIDRFQVSGKLRRSIFNILPKQYGSGGELTAIWKLPRDLFKMVWKCFF